MSKQAMGRYLWTAWIKPVVITLLVLASVRSAVADWNVVPSGSMKPTILEGDRIFVNKLAYDLKVPFTTLHMMEWADPERGDIVVFYAPLDATRMVKRVVGLPGDRIETDGHLLFVNGTLVGQAGPLVLPEVVPPDHFFVLGDNRDQSADSRWFGFVPREQVVGQATSVAFSVDPDSYRPRWDRFFSSLP
jgi:signal peptidase I